MTNSELLLQFQQINTWKSNGERAPHKPLLLLLALGKLQQGELDFIPYVSIEEKLKGLLVDFGRPQRNVRPHYPFARLANDGIWTLDKPIQVNASGDASPKELRENQVGGRFTDDVTHQLKQSPQLFREVVQSILDQNFPDTLHQDILDAIGIDLEELNGVFQIRRVRKRDPNFRKIILEAYEEKCAVCGFGVRLQNKVLALEAAHIKWHQAGGPNEQVNGLALCSTHHKLFDLGAFTVNHDLRLLVSKEIKGAGTQEWLFQYDGRSIRPPYQKSFYPDPDFTIWHVNEVFKGGYRDL